MISLKGPGFKIVAAIVGLAALVFGIYSTFFMSSGYKTTTATIVSIEEDPNYIPDPNLGLRLRNLPHDRGRRYRACNNRSDCQKEAFS